MGLETKIDDKVELAAPGGKITRLQQKAEQQREAEELAEQPKQAKSAAKAKKQS
jgi:hypothetical protein